MSIHINEIITSIAANFHGDHSAKEIDNIAIDSRSLQNNEGTLFFALKGPNYDAHLYIEDLIKKGVRNFVVQNLPQHLIGQANFLLVQNTTEALQQFASFYREKYNFPIIGITGSNGKTIIKEWLNFLLSPDYNIIRSPKSYNSQIGVPLSILAINDQHNLGIFEAGISTVSEMTHLQKIIQPNIGILTNIGTAHDEGFENIGQKIKEKLKLFSDVEVLIYEKNKSIDQFLPSIDLTTQHFAEGGKTFTWSCKDKNADVFISRNHILDKTLLQIKYKAAQFEVKIPFHDDASIENAINCLMVMLYFSYDPSIIEHRMALLYPVEMRLQVKNGFNNTTLIDDSYSSDFQSLKIALDFLESQQQYKKKTLIVSDIFQSGLSEDELYTRLSQLTISNKINRVIGIGTEISKYQKKFINCQTFPNTNDFIQNLDRLKFENETILIKGSRSFEFEKIVQILEEKKHETILEINLNSLGHNLSFYRSKLKKSTKMMAMVKAFSYGNGGFEIAKLLEHHQVDYLGVAFADEGIALKSSGIKTPIMVMNPETTSFTAIIKNQLEPEIYSIKVLNSFIKMVELHQLKDYPIHIKLDTGMHRLGFEKDNLLELTEVLRTTRSVKVISILSHLATSDDLNDPSFATKQLQLFEEMSNYLMQSVEISPIRHILNTSGISNFTNYQYDMVRLGIGLYGISNDPLEQKYLENVSQLKSVISQIRWVQEGESVGYSRRFVTSKKTKIATIPIGYADGISRKWGNGIGYVLINNQKASIVGSICMDMLMVDCTEIECTEGDSVLIFGESPTLQEMATALETIPYEIISGISQRVNRVFYRE